MKSTVLDGLYYWGVYQPDRRIDFNGFYWAGVAGGVLIDPMPLPDGGAQLLAARGGARFIVLTNADHFRATAELAQETGARVLAPSGERGRFEAMGRAAAVDGYFESTADLPAELQEGIDVHPVRGGKSDVEAALFLRPVRALLFGDVVRCHASGRLTLLPDEKLADRAIVVRDLCALKGLAPRALLLGDGDSVFTGAEAAFAELLRGLS